MKANEITRSAFLFSIMADDVEQLQPLNERRDLCSLCLLQSDIKAGKKGTPYNELLGRSSRVTMRGMSQVMEE